MNWFGYGRQNTSPRCVIKVDIKKAFDSVNWTFLQTILPLFGFPDKFCNWIITCITSTRFSLNINGSSVGYFEGRRGLRQGDPLSPLLFVLCMEVLSRILRKMQESHNFSYHPKCCRLGLTHLIFADDLLVFARGDYPSIKAVESCLHSFAEYSGLQPNPSKTNIYFGGVHPQVRFLNSVIFGIENFWCASFILPKGVIQEMDRLCRQFLWNYQTGRKMIFFAWSKVCRARQQGGFDIREILSWNKTLLMKLFWKITKGTQSVWVLWCNKYLIQGNDCWTVAPGQATSTIWKALLHTRDEFISQAGSLSNAQNLLRDWSSAGKLMLHKIYPMFHGRHPTLQWTRPLMDPVVMPRHAVITRMAVQNGLPTVDNLIRRGMVMVNRCVLCLADMESIRHLFFTCPYSHDVMQRVLLWLGLTRRPLCLRQELLKLSRYKGKGWRKKWARCCIAAAVYLIWQQRNWRLFDRGSRSVEHLVNQIKYFVSIRLYANVSDSLLEEIVAQMIP
ncbi:uncharacterized protein LOC141651299 [Silene latifolia]|uniref:uncharacterized protein LOC141651299 n=1 Tax=Silene latifolia TaxID=37657 RepID=UPI003D77BC9C